MPVLPICLFPSSSLRTPSKPADWKNPNTQRLIKDLVETLYAQRGGIGIAAPQVGRNSRVIVVNVSPRDPTKKCEIMINPKITRSEGEVLSREGCMSLPDYTANVIRRTKVKAEWMDAHGKRCERTFSGIEAICLQHEIDHLNGILFIDRVASLKTDVFPRRRRP